MDDLFNNLSDDFFGLNTDYAEQQKWDQLIDQICEGRVVPVIGPEILIEEGNLHQKMVEVIASQLGVTSRPTISPSSNSTARS